MVEIQLDDKNWLFSDKNQYMIGEKGERKDKNCNMIIENRYKSYHTSLTNALRSYYDMGLKQSKATSWEELLKDSKTIKKRIDIILRKIEKGDRT